MKNATKATPRSKEFTSNQRGEESISMEQFFGLNEFVETEDFDNAIERFIQAMSATYIQQGRKLKQSKKNKHGKNS